MNPSCYYLRSWGEGKSPSKVRIREFVPTAHKVLKFKSWPFDWSSQTQLSQIRGKVLEQTPLLLGCLKLLWHQGEVVEFRGRADWRKVPGRALPVKLKLHPNAVCPLSTPPPFRPLSLLPGWHKVSSSCVSSTDPKAMESADLICTPHLKQFISGLEKTATSKVRNWVHLGKGWADLRKEHIRGTSGILSTLKLLTMGQFWRRLIHSYKRIFILLYVYYAT